MLEETASVLSIEDNRAKVVLVRSDACGACSAKKICHPASGETMVMEVLNAAGAKPGDRVIVSLPPGQLLKASATAYLLPAVAAVVGGAVGWSRTGTDPGAIAGTVTGLTLAGAYLFWQGRKKGQAMPHISRVL